MKEFLIAFNALIFVYFAVINAVYLFLVVMGWVGIRRQNRIQYLFSPEQIIQSPNIRPISVIAPAYNEEASIIASVSSLLQQQYPNFEVVVVNDGSKDETACRLIEHFQMVSSLLVYRHQLPCKAIRAIYISAVYPRLIVVDKENGGKADALNAGINVARYNLVCNIDADSLLEKDALIRVVRPFYRDPSTLAVGANIRVVNSCRTEAGEVVDIRMPRSWLACFQVVEYLRAFLFGRVGWDEIGGTLIISGAFGLFNKQAVIAVGGYDAASIGEDMELVVRLHRWGYTNLPRHRIRYIADTACWTEVPEEIAILKRQRARWQRGLMQTLRKHNDMCFCPKYGTVGMIAMPFFFLFEMLGPIVETLGYLVVLGSWFFGIVNWYFAFWFLVVSLFLGTLLSLTSAVLMEITTRRYPLLRDVLKLMAASILENLGYRQMHNFFRVIGIIQYYRGAKGWGEMKKKGFTQQPPAGSAS